MDLGVILLEGDLEAISESGGQRVPVDEEILALGVTQGALGGKHHAGHDQVDMWMMLHLPAPGVEHGGEAGLAAEFGQAGILEGGGGFAQQQAVEDGGMPATDAAQGIERRTGAARAVHLDPAGVILDTFLEIERAARRVVQPA